MGEGIVRISGAHEGREQEGMGSAGPTGRRGLWRIAEALAGAVVVVAAAAAIDALTGSTVSALDPPHGPYSMTSDQCATCHRGHTGKNKNILLASPAQSNLCFTCHNGTGSVYNVAAQYSDPFVPANDPATRSYYSHPATIDLGHVSGKKPAEFAGVQNRHAECGDCHDAHRANAALPVMTALGWTASGSLSAATGVQAAAVNGNVTTAWQDPVQYEYQLCLKCHSSYTVLLPNPLAPPVPTPYPYTYVKTDKAAEIVPSNASPTPYVNNSYHPVAAPGTNNTVQMANSLAGGTVWRFSVNDTIRCNNCHAGYKALGTPVSIPLTPAPTLGPGTPTPTPVVLPSVRLAPHTSQYRSVLLANYNSRDLKLEGVAFNPNDFALCFLCHSSAPFSTTSKNPRSDTRFELHGFHVGNIDNDGDPGLGTDINRPGAGQGNAICAECHFEIHSTKSALAPSNRTYSRLVNFAPNILPADGQGPSWVQAVNGNSDGTCTLTCHGKDHSPKDYGRWDGGNGPAPLAGAGGVAGAPGPGTNAGAGTTGGAVPGGGTSAGGTPVAGDTPVPSATPIPTPKPFYTPAPSSTPIPQPLGTDECNGRDCGPAPYRVICGPRGWFIDVGYDFVNRWGWSEYLLLDITLVRAVCAQ